MLHVHSSMAVPIMAPGMCRVCPGCDMLSFSRRPPGAPLARDRDAKGYQRPEAPPPPDLPPLNPDLERDERTFEIE